MVAVQSLCSRVIWLNEGRIKEDGQASQVVSDYLKTTYEVAGAQTWEDITSAPGNETVRLHRVRVQPEDGSASDQITMQTPFVIETEYWNLLPNTCLHITLHVHTEQGIIAFTSGSAMDPAWENRPLQEGLYRSVCHVPGSLLNSGRHYVSLLVVKDRSRVIYRHKNAASFDTLDLTERLFGVFGKEPGVVQPVLEWTTERIGKGLAAKI
jgi:lipopolysaccharide transport system ATP-binding protein